MYGHDAEKPRPSLYTKYYRTSDLSHAQLTNQIAEMQVIDTPRCGCLLEIDHLHRKFPYKKCNSQTCFLCLPSQNSAIRKDHFFVRARRGKRRGWYSTALIGKANL